MPSWAFQGHHLVPVWLRLQPQGPKANILVSGNEIRQFAHFLMEKLNGEPGWGPWAQDIPGKPEAALQNRLILEMRQSCCWPYQEFQMKTVTRPGRPRLADVVRLVSNASMLVSMHGAQLVTALFLPLRGSCGGALPCKVNPDHYTSIRRHTLLGMDLQYIAAWQNTMPENTVTHPERPGIKGALLHLDRRAGPDPAKPGGPLPAPLLPEP